jgi:WD40 repeat protein
MRVSKRVVGVGLINILIVLGGLVQALLLNLPTASGKEPQQQQSILTPAFSIKLPDFPFPMAWSQDSKWIAISGFNTGDVRLIDVEHQKLTDKILVHGAGPLAMMSWSQDGSMIAIVTPNGLTIVSVGNGSEIVRGPKQADDCWFPSLANDATPIMTFTPDGKSLWIACLVATKDVKYTAAVKLKVPTLEIEDRIEDDAPVPGLRSSCTNYIMSSRPDGILLTRTPKAHDDQSEAKTARTFLSVLNISTKSRLFAPIEVASKIPDYPALTKAIVTDKNTTVVFRYAYSDVPAVAIFDNNSASLISVFGATNAFNRAQAYDMVASNDGALIITSLIENFEKNIGGIAVWNADTGALLQHFKSGAGHKLSLSPDGKYLAFHENGELKFDSINR